MSLRIHHGHGVQLKQSPASELKLRCYTCLSLHRNLKPIDPGKKYLLAMLCPEIFCRAQPNTQNLICWECEFMTVKIKQFQAKLIKACNTREQLITAVEGLSTLKLTGIVTIEVPPTPPTNESMRTETLMTPFKQDTGVTEIKIEKEESEDYDEMIQPIAIQQEFSDDSTDTASETDTLTNEDPLKTTIKKSKKHVMKFGKLEVPLQEPVKDGIIAPNVKFNYKHQKAFINEPKEKLAQAYRGPVNIIVEVPNMVTNKETNLILVKSKESVPMVVKDKVRVPIVVKGKGSVSNLVKGERSSPHTKSKEIALSLSKTKGMVVAKQDIPNNLNPPIEPVEPEPQQRLHIREGIYGYEEDEVKCVVLNITELNTYREKKRSGIFKGWKIKCDRCIEKFNTQEKLDEHNKKHDKSRGPLICEVCEQRFSDEKVRNEHYKQHFIIFECLKCQYQNHDRIQISEHIRRRHEVSSFYCKKCHAVFKTYNEKHKHTLYVHSKRRSCEECNKTFISLSQLKLHMTNSHRKETAECPICKKMVRKNYLETHKRTHDDTRNDSAYCVVCEKTFKSQQSYEKHLKTSLKHNTIEQIGLKCDHCNKYFPNAASLKNHVEEINGVKYKCHICNKESKNKIILARHIRAIHMGQKPRYKPRICEYCGKSFTIKKSLEQHINKHLGHRPLVCKDCGATFIYSAALFTHRRLVHKVKRRYEMTEIDD